MRCSVLKLFGDCNHPFGSLAQLQYPETKKTDTVMIIMEKKLQILTDGLKMTIAMKPGPG